MKYKETRTETVTFTATGELKTFFTAAGDCIVRLVDPIGNPNLKFYINNVNCGGFANGSFTENISAKTLSKKVEFMGGNNRLNNSTMDYFDLTLCLKKGDELQIYCGYYAPSYGNPQVTVYVYD